jgi:hypothetical protein
LKEEKMRNRTLATVSALLILGASAYCPAADMIELTALNSMERIGQSQEPDGAAAVEIKAARNEVESFQLVVAAPKENISVVEVAISDLAGPAGSKIAKENVRLFREEYVRVRMSSPRAELPPGLYADPLVPLINPETGKPIEPLNESRARWGEPVKTTGYDMYAVPFDVFKGQNQALWVDVHVLKDIPAGTYSGVLTVRARG